MQFSSFVAALVVAVALVEAHTVTSYPGEYVKAVKATKDERLMRFDRLMELTT